MAIMGANYEEVMHLLQDALDISFQIGCLEVDDVYLLKAYCCFRLGLVGECLGNLEKAEEGVKKGEFGAAYGEEDEKKLLAIKVNNILVVGHSGQT